MNVLFLSQIVPYPPHGSVLQRGQNLLRELGRHTQVHLLAFVPGYITDAIGTRRAPCRARPVLRDDRILSAVAETIPPVPHCCACGQHMLAAAVQHICPPLSGLSGEGAERLFSVPLGILHVDTLAFSRFVRRDHRLPPVLTHHNIQSKLMERRSKVEAQLLAG